MSDLDVGFDQSPGGIRCPERYGEKPSARQINPRIFGGGRRKYRMSGPAVDHCADWHPPCFAKDDNLAQREEAR